MNKHIERAKQLRDTAPQSNNCAQTIMRAYAEEMGLTEEQAAVIINLHLLTTSCKSAKVNISLSPICKSKYLYFVFSSTYLHLTALILVISTSISFLLFFSSLIKFLLVFLSTVLRGFLPLFVVFFSLVFFSVAIISILP